MSEKFLDGGVERLRWYYLFDRFNRWQILADALCYCQEHKNLELNGYVFMLNHLHMIVTSPDVAGFLRDFKRFTSKKLKENIQSHEPRVLDLFVDEKGNYHFWTDTNAPKKIENPAFYLQKLNYIHENPVRKGYVERPEYFALVFCQSIIVIKRWVPVRFVSLIDKPLHTEISFLVQRVVIPGESLGGNYGEAP